MPVSITIRNVPDEVRDTLAARAARGGRSLQEHLLLLLRDQASRPALEDVVAAARGRVATTGSDITDQDILDALDADRR